MATTRQYWAQIEAEALLTALADRRPTEPEPDAERERERVETALRTLQARIDTLWLRSSQETS